MTEQWDEKTALIFVVMIESSENSFLEVLENIQREESEAALESNFGNGDFEKTSGDLFEYLDRPEGDIREILGEPTAHLGSGTLFDGGNVEIVEFDGKVCNIELINENTNYNILGYKPGDSADSLISMLESEYDAKSYGGFDFNQKEVYFYVNGEVRFVKYTFDDSGIIQALSCSYDEVGVFKEPRDVGNLNSYTFEEAPEDLLDDLD